MRASSRAAIVLLLLLAPVLGTFALLNLSLLSCEGANSLGMDAQGVVTITGSTESSDLPTTPGAYDRSFRVAAYRNA